MRGLEQIPGFYDAVMALAEPAGLDRWRRGLVRGTRGRILELGCGTGRNLHRRLTRGEGQDQNSEEKAKMGSPLKIALQDLLRARRLQAEAPPLRGEDRRLSPLPTGVPTIDALLGGGFPRGQVSEAHGPASSGRTGLALGLLARTTRRGALVAWVDPEDRLDPASAATAGVDLTRLLWLRGQPRNTRALPEALAAVGTLLGSGLFEAVVLDLAGVPVPETRRLPDATWIRLQRMVEETPTVFVLLADAHTARGPGGVSLRLEPAGPRWSGPPGPGRLLRGLGAQALAGGHAVRRAALELQAFS